jgi:rare lipoprotein A
MKNSFQLHKNRNQMNTFLRGCLLFTGLLLHLSAAAQWTWQETGNASYYADKFHGRSTASGERYNKNELTAAHRTLPMGSIVRVTHARNGQSVEVRINDCGPHRAGRVIDLSKSCGRKDSTHCRWRGAGHCSIGRTWRRTLCLRSQKEMGPQPWKAKPTVLTTQKRKW